MRSTDWPLRRLLVLTVVGLALLALLPTALLNALDTRALLRERAEDRLRRRAAVTAARVDEHLRDLVRWARELQRRPGTRAILAVERPAEPLRRRWEQDTLDFLRDAQDLTGVFVADANGRLLAQIGNVRLPAALSTWTPFVQARDQGRVIVWPLGPGSTRAHYFVLVPLKTALGTGVIGLVDDLQSLARFVVGDLHAVGPGSFGVLTDEHGVRLIHGHNRALEGVASQPLAPSVADRLEAEGRRRGVVDPADVAAVAGRQASLAVELPVQTAGWTYRLSAPVSWYAGPVRDQLVRVGVASLLVLLVAAALSVVLARRLSRPFADLEATVAAWRDGERGVRAPETGTREAARFSAAFNQMAEEIATYERSLQDQVRERTAQLQLANDELEMFTCSASHDLRVPLRVVEGLTGFVLEDNAGRLPEESREMLERVLATAGRMQTLIDDLLAFGRASRHDRVCETVDVSAMARGIAAELAAASSERRVEVTVADRLTAHGDPSLLRIALENLLANAWIWFTVPDPQRGEPPPGADRAAQRSRVKTSG